MKQPTTAAEQVAVYGSRAVSDKQLLECIGIPAPAAEELMVRAENRLANIAKMGIPEIVTINGISKSKATAIVAAIELGRRRQSESAINKATVSESRDMFEILHPHMRDLNEERFFVAFLDRRNKIIKVECVHIGGMAAMIVDAKVVFRKALENKANSIILSHNHPSGAPSPSMEDIKLTEKMKVAGQLIDIKVLDHIIIGDGNYYSFADEGKM